MNFLKSKKIIYNYLKYFITIYRMFIKRFKEITYLKIVLRDVLIYYLVQKKKKKNNESFTIKYFAN